MIFSDAYANMGLPPQSMDQKRLLWKSILFREIPMFWGADVKNAYKTRLKIKFSKKSMKNWFEPINKNDFSRRISLCPRFFHISPQMMSYIDFSKKNWKIIFLIGFF